MQLMTIESILKDRYIIYVNYNSNTRKRTTFNSSATLVALIGPKGIDCGTAAENESFCSKA
jgi:hypothetical protein